MDAKIKGWLGKVLPFISDKARPALQPTSGEAQEKPARDSVSITAKRAVLLMAFIVALLSLSVYGLRSPAQIRNGTIPVAASTPTTLALPEAVPAPVVTDQRAQVFSFSGDDSAVSFVAYNRVGQGRKGGISDFRGTITLSGGRLDTAVIEASMKTKSIFSDSTYISPKLRTVSKGRDFFEAGKFPTAAFKSTKVAPRSDEPTAYMITGTFSLHGIERPVTMPATIVVEGNELTAKAKFSISRQDWKINGGEGNWFFKDEVLIDLDIHGIAPKGSDRKSSAPPNSPRAVRTGGAIPVAANTPPALAPPKAVPTPVAPNQEAQVFTFSGDDSAISFIFYHSSIAQGRESGFSDFGGTITLAGGRLDTAAIEATIKMKSVWSDSEIINSKFKKLTKRKDVFETDKFPTATFKSTNVALQPGEATACTIAGTFELQGIERPVTIPATIVVKGNELTATAKFPLNRQEWKITCGEGDEYIKDEVLVKLEIHGVAAPSAKGQGARDSAGRPGGVPPH